MFTTKTRMGYPPKARVVNQELATEYDAGLDDLKVNSKPLIDTLTVVAQENIQSASDIVTLIENRIANNPDNVKLPVIYLMDSVLKNVGGPYNQLFARNLFETFCNTHSRVDATTKAAMQVVLRTWREQRLFATPLLDKIDARISGGVSHVHVNPDFVKPERPGTSAPRDPLFIDRKPKRPEVSVVPSVPTHSGLSSMNHMQTGLSPEYNYFLNMLGINAPSDTVETTEELFSRAEFLILSILFAYVFPNDPIPSPPQLVELQTRILDNLHHAVMQGRTPPDEITQTITQLQQLYFIKSSLAPPQPVIQQDPLTILSTAPPGDSFIPEKSILDAIHTSHANAPRGGGRGGRKGGRGRREHDHTSVPKFQPGASPDPSAGISGILASTNFSDIHNIIKKAGLQNIESDVDINDVASLSRHNPNVISSLYDNFLDQCSQCGWRFKDQEKLSKHYDWHFRQNKREKEKTKKAMSRMWYLNKEAWTAEEVPGREFQMDTAHFEEPAEPQELTQEESLLARNLVIAREDQMECPVCREPFKQYYDPDTEEWLCKESVLAQDDIIYHIFCLPANNVTPAVSDSKLEPSTPEATEEVDYLSGVPVIKMEEPKTPEQVEENGNIPAGNLDNLDSRGQKRLLDEDVAEGDSHHAKKPKTDIN